MNYFEVLYSNGFNKKYVHLLATKQKTLYQTNQAYATGYNGCKIIDYKRTDFGHFRKMRYNFIPTIKFQFKN